MRVPEIQAAIRDIATQLNTLADELSRRKPVKRAAVTSTPMTAALARKIRAHAKANPGMSQAMIGKTFNVNIGRVSEALYGKRK